MLALTWWLLPALFSLIVLAIALYVGSQHDIPGASLLGAIVFVIGELTSIPFWIFLYLCQV